MYVEWFTTKKKISDMHFKFIAFNYSNKSLVLCYEAKMLKMACKWCIFIV